MRLEEEEREEEERFGGKIETPRASFEECISSGRKGRYRCSRRNYRSGKRAGGEYSIEEELKGRRISRSEGMKVEFDNGTVELSVEVGE